MLQIAVAHQSGIHIGAMADAVISGRTYDARLVALSGWGIAHLWSRPSESYNDTLMFLGMVPGTMVQ